SRSIAKYIVIRIKLLPPLTLSRRGFSRRHLASKSWLIMTHAVPRHPVAANRQRQLAERAPGRRARQPVVAVAEWRFDLGVHQRRRVARPGRRPHRVGNGASGAAFGADA